jgi:hypothetical protein
MMGPRVKMQEPSSTSSNALEGSPSRGPSNKICQKQKDKGDGNLSICADIKDFFGPFSLSHCENPVKVCFGLFLPPSLPSARPQNSASRHLPQLCSSSGRFVGCSARTRGLSFPSVISLLSLPNLDSQELRVRTSGGGFPKFDAVLSDGAELHVESCESGFYLEGSSQDSSEHELVDLLKVRRIDRPDKLERSRRRRPF